MLTLVANTAATSSSGSTALSDPHRPLLCWENPAIKMRVRTGPPDLIGLHTDGAPGHACFLGPPSGSPGVQRPPDWPPYFFQRNVQCTPEAARRTGTPRPPRPLRSRPPSARAPLPRPLRGSQTVTKPDCLSLGIHFLSPRGSTSPGLGPSPRPPRGAPVCARQLAAFIIFPPTPPSNRLRRLRRGGRPIPLTR